MDARKRLVLLEVTLLVLILIACLIIQWRTNVFERDCKIQFDLNDSCPCKKPDFQRPNYVPPNFTSFFKLVEESNK